MIKLNKLSFQYDESDFILQDINYTFNNGKIYIVYGKNGAGKTTLLKILSRYYMHNNEQISFDEDNLIAYIPDSTELPDYLTGRQYIYLIGKINKRNEKFIHKKIEELDKIFDMSNKLDDLIKNYSLGMKHKVILMSSLAFNPNIVILDEPFTSIDPVSVNKIRKYFSYLTSKNVMIIISTHQMENILNFKAEYLHLCNKRIQQENNPEDFFKEGKESAV